jgi:hypothetical protein
MKAPWIFAFFLAWAAGLAWAEDAPVSPLESSAEAVPQGKIDELVFGRLKHLGIRPARLCSDGVFVRRAYLDILGTLPLPREVRPFLNDPDVNKRRDLVDRLLARQEFADYWAMKWGDLLRIKAEFPIDLWPNAAQAYSHWIHDSLRDNKPYDQFARELLTASGSNFRAPPVNFYRAVQSRQPEAFAQAVALTFMGQRAENWPKERLAGMAAFFARIGYKYTGEWKEEIVFFDPAKAAKGARFPDGTAATLAPDRDPREVFAAWLVAPENPYFARNIVNRIWYWLLGRGIVHEPDDLRPDNLPANPELLAYLERELVASHYDLKHVYRLILTSATYQLSCVPRSDRPEAAANFAQYPLRRLEAEVLADALCQVTGTSEKYSSAIPEPFTFIPADHRAIALEDGSISSPFLEMFGRPPRDTGLEAERNNRPTAEQRLHLLNSSHIQRKIEQSRRLQSLSQGTPRQMVNGLYLLVLSRFPTDEELKAADEYSRSGALPARQVVNDLAWALINSKEFLYRH